MSMDAKKLDNCRIAIKVDSWFVHHVDHLLRRRRPQYPSHPILLPPSENSDKFLIDEAGYGVAQSELKRRTRTGSLITCGSFARGSCVFFVS